MKEVVKDSEKRAQTKVTENERVRRGSKKNREKNIRKCC